MKLRHSQKAFDNHGEALKAPVKVLCVDDDGLLLTSYEHTLAKEYEVYSAYNLHDARILLRQHDFAVILCDQCVAGADGVEFLNHAHECLPGCVQLLLGEPCSDKHAEPHQVFRRLSRPLTPAILRRYIDEARDRYYFQLAQCWLHQCLMPQ